MEYLPKTIKDYLTFLRQVLSGKGKSKVAYKLTELQERGQDKWGSGAYLASRGGRDHNGVDLAVQPETEIKATFAGTVTKLGFPYGDDLNYRYVQISKDGYDYRIFYVHPIVNIGDEVTEDTIIGTSQNLNKRYEGITEHVHLEVKKDGEFVNPCLTLKETKRN